MPRERRDPAYKQVVSMLRAKPRTASLTVDLRVRKAKSTINATAMTVKMRYVTKGPANDLKFLTIALAMPAGVCGSHKAVS